MRSGSGLVLVPDDEEAPFEHIADHLDRTSADGGGQVCALVLDHEPHIRALERRGMALDLIVTEGEKSILDHKEALGQITDDVLDGIRRTLAWYEQLFAASCREAPAESVMSQPAAASVRSDEADAPSGGNPAATVSEGHRFIERQGTAVADLVAAVLYTIEAPAADPHEKAARLDAALPVVQNLLEEASSLATSVHGLVRKASAGAAVQITDHGRRADLEDALRHLEHASASLSDYAVDGQTGFDALDYRTWSDREGRIMWLADQVKRHVADASQAFHGRPTAEAGQ